MDDVFYEVTWADPHTDSLCFRSLKEAVLYARECYGFKSLVKISKKDYTYMLVELESMLDE